MVCLLKNALTSSVTRKIIRSCLFTFIYHGLQGGNIWQIRVADKKGQQFFLFKFLSHLSCCAIQSDPRLQVYD